MVGKPKGKPLTKKRFEAILEKVFTTPLPELAERKRCVQEAKRTSVSRPSGRGLGLRPKDRRLRLKHQPE